MKKCPKCKQFLNLDSFAKNKAKKDRLNSWCKNCNKLASRQHYIDNKKSRISDAREREKRIRKINNDFINSLSLKCVICNEKEQCCLDFHHFNQNEKENEISRIRSKFNLDRLKQELKKCVCVCSNCHRKIHKGLIDCPRKFVI